MIQPLRVPSPGQAFSGQEPSENLHPSGRDDGNGSPVRRTRWMEELAQVFKLLGDPTRLQILLHICERGEANVTELRALVKLSQPLVSHHLALLKGAKLLDVRREGKCHYYSIRRCEFERLMASLAAFRGERYPCHRFLECVLG